MRPRTLRLIKNSHVFDFAKSNFFYFYSLFWIDFKSFVFNRIFDFCQHIIAISVNHLNSFTHFTTRIAYFLFFALISTFRIIILCKRLS